MLLSSAISFTTLLLANSHSGLAGCS